MGSMTDTTYYAIGDVHGMANSLVALHALIREDHKRIGGNATVIHLGDYVDRGPDIRLKMTQPSCSPSRSDLQIANVLAR